MTRETLVALLLLIMVGCSKDTSTPDSGEIERVIYTTFHPTHTLTERLVGDLIPVECPLPEGTDAKNWHPPRDVVAKYQSAALIVVNGADFDHWVSHASLPGSRVVDTCRSFEDEFIYYETVTHSHGEGGEHSHQGIDGHTWLDPLNAKRQAGAISEALERAFPEHAADFKANAIELAGELDALDDRFRSITPRLQSVTLLASHAAYDYVARRYEWGLTNLDLDPEAELDDDAIPAGEGKRLMLWESPPLDATIARLRDEHGIDSVVFSPAENIPADERAAGADLISIMNDNLDRLEAAIE